MSILFKTTRFAERLHLGSESKREIKIILAVRSLDSTIRRVGLLFTDLDPPYKRGKIKGARRRCDD